MCYDRLHLDMKNGNSSPVLGQIIGFPSLCLTLSFTRCFIAEYVPPTIPEVLLYFSLFMNFDLMSRYTFLSLDHFTGLQLSLEAVNFQSP